VQIVVHSNNYLFQQKLRKKLYNFNRNELGLFNLGVWCKKWFNWTSESDKKIRLQFHPKTSDSATLPTTGVSMAC